MMPSTDIGLAGSADLAPGAGHQFISQLTPLRDVVAAFAALAPVAPRALAIADAVASAPAADLSVAALPARPLAWRDGYAVRAEETQDAGGYAPARLSALPLRVAVGDPMPASTDAVAPLDAVRIDPAGAEALAAVTAGEGVAAAGADWPGGVLRRAGERLRAGDVALLAAAGLSQVAVRRPRFLFAAAKRDALAGSIAGAIAALLARDLTAHGAAATIAAPGDLAAALDAANATGALDADAVVTLGATGAGDGDDAILTMRRRGRIVAHGIALSPGESAAFGLLDQCPVLMLPGRIDAALAAWLTLGRPLAALLGGVGAEDPTTSAVLARKVTSTIGISDVVPVSLAAGKAEPLAARDLPLTVLSRADGWILVPPQSEGYPAGTTVTVNAWL